MILRDLLRILGSDRRDGRNLTHQEAYRAFELIFQGGQSEIQTGAFLIALRWKGVTVQEVAAFAQAARDHARLDCMLARGDRIVVLCLGREPQQLLHGRRRGRLRLRDGIRFHASPSARHSAHLKPS